MGKDVISILLQSSNISVIDVGTNVDSDTFIKTALKEDAKVIGVSIPLTTVINEIKELVSKAKKNNIKVIIGGCAINKDWLNLVGAHAYAKNGFDAVKRVWELLDSK
jgi:methanogenic corrinoid protein MtbC1